MGKSVKKNYILNLINTVLGIIFPLITFPYASRILMEDGIGQVAFFDSIINYISLFSALGIPMYAIRESARVRDDDKLLSITTTEILVLHFILSFIGYVAVGVVCLTVVDVQKNIPLFLLLSTSIALSVIGVNWFYQGIEDFKYITIRNIAVKIVTILLLFSLVHKKSDLLWYALVLVIGNVGNNVFNFFRLRKYISFSSLSVKEIHPQRHLKPALRIFILNIIISIYTQLDLVMLGFMKSPTEVGYFTAATKITTVLLAVATSLGTVLLPRLSNLISNNEMDEFKRLSQKAVDFIFLIAAPLFLGLMALASPMIRVICGESFESSILCLQIISPIVLVIALSNVIGIQILYPQGKENIVIYSTIVGAIFNLVLNFILIPRYAQNGAAVSTVIAEIGVTVTQIFLGLKFVPVKFFNKSHFLILVSAIIMFCFCCFLQKISDIAIIQLGMVTILGALLYFLLLFLFKEPVTIEFVKCFKKNMRKSYEHV